MDLITEAQNFSSHLSTLFDQAQILCRHIQDVPNTDPQILQIWFVLQNALVVADKLVSVVKVASTPNVPSTPPTVQSTAPTLQTTSPAVLNKSQNKSLFLSTSSSLRRSGKTAHHTYEPLLKQLTSSGRISTEGPEKQAPKEPPTPPPIPNWHGVHKGFSMEVYDGWPEEPETQSQIEEEKIRMKELEEEVEKERQRRIEEDKEISKGLTSGIIMTNIVKSIRAENDVNVFKIGGHTPSVTEEIKDPIWKILDIFRSSEELSDICKNWELLKKSCELKPGDDIYEILKQKTLHGTFWCKTMWQHLDKKLSHINYTSAKVSNKKVVIIGAGPAGLATAIECACMGASVFVIEKRSYITRNNILHLWPYTMEYLKDMSAKTFYSKFGTGSIDHIGTKQLQRLFLKVALIMGVNIYCGTSYEGLEKQEDGLHKIKTKPQLELPSFDVMVAADGENSFVAKELGFLRREFTGSLSLGITFNFVNHRTQTEVGITEFGIAKQFCQKFFRDLQSDYDIDLENLVYYRGETHYLVMTAKKESLLRRGVLLHECPENSELIHRSNISVPNLLQYVRDVGTYIGIPDSCEMVLTHYDQPDVAIFDFSKRLMSNESTKILSEGRQYVTLVGDALLEPFWPLGTGCNRALLSALDAAWMLKEIGDGVEPEKVVQNRWVSYKKMESILGPAIKQPYCKCSVDPGTRYANSSTFCGI